MHILVIGSGGREHALAWKLKQSPLTTRLACAPGNAGMAMLGDCVSMAATDGAAITAYCQRESVDFVVIGPDAALAAGVADRLAEKGIAHFGPSQAATRIESSKSFAKELCVEAGIPTAAYATFKSAAPAKAYLRTMRAPYVIKADGLALGKGVVIAKTLEDADRTVGEMLAGAFGDSSKEIVIEEFLDGEEISFFALSDGTHALPLIAVQDHKRAFDNDEGPNTGGMGAYAPVPAFTQELQARVMREVMEPALRALARRGTPFCGVLFAGIMLTESGPKQFEFNARFGDPECQVMMVLLKSDLLPTLIACSNGTLARERLSWHDVAALTVVLATRGYPGSYAKGSLIRGLDAANAVPGVHIFHAGTASRGKDLLANGGRVLNVTARAATIAEARARAYEAVKRIDWPEGFCRSDIGWRAMQPR